MNIDDKILNNLEKLAKLNIKEENQSKTIEKIKGILDMLDKIDDSSIEGLEPLYHPLEIQQAMREDIPDHDIDRDYLQSQSPQVENGLFLVPKVLD